MKPRGGRAGVEPVGIGGAVFSEIEEHVADSVAHLAGSGQGAGVVAVAPDAPAATEGAVDGAGDPDGQAQQAAGERVLVLCLDEDVQVIALLLNWRC
jgi:hypothetical protein